MVSGEDFKPSVVGRTPTNKPSVIYEQGASNRKKHKTARAAATNRKEETTGHNLDVTGTLEDTGSLYWFE